MSWVALGLVTLLLVAVLGVRELTLSRVTDVPPPAVTEVGASARRLGPLLDATRVPPRAIPARPGTVALTFDGGPDPAWTPKLLDVLRAKGVPATFFTVGARAVRHTDLLRRMTAEGHEIGIGSFTGGELGTVPAWRATAELAAAHRVVRAATGRTVPLVRPPGTSTTAALSAADLEAIRRAGRSGHHVVLADRDADAAPGVTAAQIVRNLTTGAAATTSGAGLVVKLRDGGRDRSQTLAALPALIDALSTAGFRFATVSAATGQPVAAAPVGWDAGRAGGLALIVAARVADLLVAVVAVLYPVLLGVTLLRVIALLVTAVRHKRVRRGWGPEVRDPVTVVVPAYNEEVGIASTIRSLRASDHPEVEILVLDDGSTDRTAEVVEELIAEGGPHRVRLMRQRNAGKPAAINAGLRAASHDLIVLVDGDTVVEASTVRELVQPFSDPAIGGVAGNAKVANRGGLLGRCQHIEYVTGCSLDRRMYDLLSCVPTVPGAVGAYRRKAIEDAGGVPADTLAEDTDLTIVVGRVGWRLVYAERARAWTEVPSGLRQFWLQRLRWSYGTLQALWKHRAVFGRRGRFTLFGTVGMPYLLLTHLVVPLLSPLADVLVLFELLHLRPWRALVLFAVFLALQLVTSLVAFRLDGERLRVLWMVPVQQLVYRQVMFLVTLHSLLYVALGVPLRWHKLHRVGISDPRSPSTASPSTVSPSAASPP
ncbi:bifunctional polysaccharide deacetylase/glycosyltransferase family 2 protein [Actinomadura sp. 6N118]|uniref:bifunctional polysaccharide deacetylase/glycosyltransferase family 2 protein n=1 Tax=Actinomadura sp. 6N118 TaxID=3375151 RepID=UPI0037A541BC